MWHDWHSLQSLAAMLNVLTTYTLVIIRYTLALLADNTHLKALAKPSIQPSIRKKKWPFISQNEPAAFDETWKKTCLESVMRKEVKPHMHIQRIHFNSHSNLGDWSWLLLWAWFYKVSFIIHSCVCVNVKHLWTESLAGPCIWGKQTLTRPCKSSQQG